MIGTGMVLSCGGGAMKLCGARHPIYVRHPIKGRMPAEQGAMIMKALELAVERSRKSTKVNGPAANGEYHDAPSKTCPGESMPNRRADALAEIAETYLNAEPSAASSADRYQVVVHVSPDTLIEPTHVPAETSRRIACDCSKITIIDDKNSEPLSIGRKSRTIPPASRRALRTRDKGCRFPGCTNSHYVDGHHIKHWADGGETSLANLIQLCRQHHRLVHEGGFDCERLNNGKFIFKDPTGNLSIEPWQLASPPDAEEPITWIESQMPDVIFDAKTCVSLWTGERIDWNLAVGHLFV